MSGRNHPFCLAALDIEPGEPDESHDARYRETGWKWLLANVLLQKIPSSRHNKKGCAWHDDSAKDVLLSAGPVKQALPTEATEKGGSIGPPRQHPIRSHDQGEATRGLGEQVFGGIEIGDPTFQIVFLNSLSDSLD